MTSVAALLLYGAAPGATSICNIRAYTADPDPKGTNVRAAPSRDAKIVARLPQAVGIDPPFTPELVITGFQDGWARVSRAELIDYDAGTETVLFQGEGWISGKLLSTALNHPALRSRPAEDAPEIAHLQGEDWGADSVLVQAIEDCRGDFARVVAKLPDGKVVTGWADGVCSNQVTTCP